MAYKNINFNTAATKNFIGDAPRVRVRLHDDEIQIRFTDRKSPVNLPKGEMLRNLTAKGNSRRMGLPSEVADRLETGAKIALMSRKYGWFAVVPAANASVAEGSISAK